MKLRKLTDPYSLNLGIQWQTARNRAMKNWQIDSFSWILKNYSLKYVGIGNDTAILNPKPEKLQLQYCSEMLPTLRISHTNHFSHLVDGNNDKIS